MVIVLTIAGFVFLGLASMLWKAHKASKDDYTDFDLEDSEPQPVPVPVKVKSNVVTLNERRK